MSTYGPEIAVASRLAREAGIAIERVRLAGFDALSKRDRTPVTEADLASDRILTEGLTAAFPADGLLSEESGYGPGTSGRTWILDPLDGTEGFIEGAAGYAVHVGLHQHGRAVAGVVYEPHSDRLYHAALGSGAWLEEGSTPPRRLRVSDRTELDQMPMVTSSSLPADTRRDLLDAIGLANGGTVRSVGAKIGAIVRHEADIYVSAHPISYWDSCAPLVVLLEAGGRLTLADGRDLRFPLGSEAMARVSRGDFQHAGPFLASNATRHEELLERVGARLGW